MSKERYMDPTTGESGVLSEEASSIHPTRSEDLDRVKWQHYRQLWAVKFDADAFIAYKRGSPYHHPSPLPKYV